MIRIANIISGVMLKLSVIPGLTFLQSYVVSARGMQTRFGQRKGDYEAYISGARGAVGDLRGAAGTPHNLPGQDVGEDEFEDGFEDGFDDYDDSGYCSNNAAHPGDDYPASDAHITYYDDDYTSY